MSIAKNATNAQPGGAEMFYASMIVKGNTRYYRFTSRGTRNSMVSEFLHASVVNKNELTGHIYDGDTLMRNYFYMCETLHAFSY